MVSGLGSMWGHCGGTVDLRLTGWVNGVIMLRPVRHGRGGGPGVVCCKNRRSNQGVKIHRHSKLSSRIHRRSKPGSQLIVQLIAYPVVFSQC